MTPQKDALDCANECPIIDDPMPPDPLPSMSEVKQDYIIKLGQWLYRNKSIVKIAFRERAALQAAQVPAEYRIADQSMAEAYQELFGMLCELKSPPLHSEMNDIINLVLKHWRNK